MIDRRIGNENDIILKKADELATRIYTLIKAFPKSELFGLTSQLRRAALSVPLNIVEGYGRIGRNDHKHFLEIALGSLRETNYLIYFSWKQNYISESEKESVLELGDYIAKMLWKKTNTLSKEK